jgi:hypothetical protein
MTRKAIILHVCRTYNAALHCTLTYFYWANNNIVEIEIDKWNPIVLVIYLVVISLISISPILFIYLDLEVAAKSLSDDSDLVHKIIPLMMGWGGVLCIWNGFSLAINVASYIEYSWWKYVFYEDIIWGFLAIFIMLPHMLSVWAIPWGNNDKT